MSSFPALTALTTASRPVKNEEAIVIEDSPTAAHLDVENLMKCDITKLNNNVESKWRKRLVGNKQRKSTVNSMTYCIICPQLVMSCRVKRDDPLCA